MYRKFLLTISKLKWIGCIGLIGMATNNANLTLFIYFWYFGILEIILTFPTFVQSLYQIYGLFYIKFLKKGPFPSKDNYVCKNNYILPFKGTWTVVNGGVEKEYSHSWGVYTQRYAYDFIIINKKNYSYSKDHKVVSNYLCYDKEVIAPADGIVVEIKNNAKDSYVDGLKAYCDAHDLRGNYIIIDHGQNEFSCTAHIKKGSITVKAGDSVKQGDVIAKVGNSGNTSQPHIHFQLQSGKGFFTSYGLPIAFSNITANKVSNYNELDTRLVQDIITLDDKKVFIGRGQSVENNE